VNQLIGISEAAPNFKGEMHWGRRFRP
jgi:hypothetical protein